MEPQDHIVPQRGKTRERSDTVKRLGALLTLICSLAMLGLAAGVMLWWKDIGAPPAERVRQKSTSRLIAENVRYRDYQSLGVDRFAFKSCRVEKRRNGAIIFGAFNVLVVDELVLNLPPPAFFAGGTNGCASDRVKDGFAETLLRSQRAAVGRVSSLRVNGMTVNRCVSNRVERVFSAAQAESGMKKEELRLRNCRVYAPGGNSARVDTARLVLKPEPALVYIKGGVEQRIEL